MKKREYLQSALSEGLMFTDHSIEFSPTKDRMEMETIFDEIFPILKQRLNALGRPFESLSEERRKAIFSGIGTVSSKIPMLCFSEIPEGRNVRQHGIRFGNYGLVLSDEWIAKNNADRVVYVGQNSPLSIQLFYSLAIMRMYSLYIDPSGEVFFDNHALSSVLRLFVYFEERNNLEQMEWRIVGNPGFMGGKRETGKRLPLPLDSIKYVLVPDDNDEVKEFKILVESLAKQQGMFSNLPEVIKFPDAIPH